MAVEVEVTSKGVRDDHDYQPDAIFLPRPLLQHLRAQHGQIVEEMPAGEGIERVPREVFADLATSGEVSLRTTVFNNTLTSLADVRAGRWEVPASASWHAQAFF